ETWAQIASLLDGAMGKLGRKDHDALVLRFFENKNFAEVGAALGASEDAAKMRVGRALEKLRRFFAKRGVNPTAAAIGETISANSVQTAPAALAKTVTAVALAKGAAASTSTLTLTKGALKVMAWTKVKTAIVTGVVVLLAAGTTTVVVEKAAHYYSLRQRLDYASPQVHMKTYFIEVPERDVAAILKAGTIINTTNGNSVEILDADKVAQLFRLFRSDRAQILAAPQVVTLADRQTMMRAGNVSVDLVPTLLDDGYTLKMKIIASASETLTADANVWDGQTIALGTQKSDGQNRLFVFTTVQLIDAAGNALHPKTRLPIRPGTIPPQ
ncbi:MAG: hypothetical protein KGJ88_04170, partial [Verrucomicrobiota bacterium]|nr:hypothetical protein [Verrucomicrobiota bacterium]